MSTPDEGDPKKTQAHLQKKQPALAKAALERLMQMRIVASGDPLILEAKRLLTTL